ncbi:hypothetical protein L228DRAFT_251070 [Xylona heveae TC161]|uniref:RRM domain-containing protein n=1 Tax=Xylona heveae (strain CBS 132557 / TC161) TaxID=1328760 RepID=A0A164ZT31_XYLHT|nr:hypothetical protein L228DRAFT_251070 [Xylona heveae TC161]KZF19476.1 hypothetical protein L228DRAFT_251070 [Xylona heveae TC161]
MAAAGAPISIAKPSADGPVNGILAVNPSAIQKGTSAGNTPKTSSSRSNAPRLKVIIRRLPPAFSATELDTALGDEWKVGAGKIDWAQYRPGKVSKDPAKPSRPSRAYLHLTDTTHLNALSELVRNTTFHDAKGTFRDPCLLAPPTAEFAPYGRIPNGRRRNDARQGTIDQDPEFIDFLESLTNPIQKPPNVDNLPESTSKKEEAATTTPLVQYIKEKKAAKTKEPSTTSRGSKESRSERVSEKRILTKSSKDAASSQEKKGSREARAERGAKDPIKVLSREASTPSKRSQPSSPTVAAAPSKETERKRERGNASAAAKILQRDLGLGSGSGRRGSKRETSTETTSAGTSSRAQSSSKQDEPATKPSSPAPTEKGASTSTRAPKGEGKRARGEKKTEKSGVSSTTPSQTPSPAPTLLKKPGSGKPGGGQAASRPASKGSSANTASSNAPTQSTSAGPTQAFLKHANVSQGITEPLVTTSMSAYGKVTKVEMDKRKGFAYVDFADAQGLQAAVKASPVSIGQGQVTIVERKPQARSTPSAKGGKSEGRSLGHAGGNSGAIPAKGGRGRGRGGGGAGRGSGNAGDASTA